MNLADRLPRGPRTAIVDRRGRETSFDALAAAGERVARGLRARIAPEERLMLLLTPGVPFYEAVFGLFRARAVAVAVDPGMGLARARACVAPLGVRGLVGSPLVQALRLFAPELRGGAVYACPTWCPFTERLDALDGPAIPQEATHPDTPALLTFTTGSTGRPKAMVRTHGLLEAQRAALAAHMRVTHEDVSLETLPVFALASLAAGATVVLADCDLRRPGSVDPAPVVAQMRARRVTVATASPAFFAPIARWLVTRGETYRGLRALWTGGARVPAALLRELCAAFPEAAVEVLYGSSEAEPIAGLDVRAHLDELDGGEADGRGALVGAPVPEIAVRVVRPGTFEETDDVGEIVVAGAHVNPSYFRDPTADAATKVHAGGRVWHRTGDTGRLDARGRLWLVGRVADVVCGLHPYPLEAAAERVPGVRRAALIERAGAPLLCVEGDAAALPRVRDTVRHVDVSQVPRIPVDRRHNAKVDRAALRALVG